ncbi:MAG: FixH family protein [Capsulimonas sp.]|uniref:FixH family protein n=1 Tax=Capsulimonas sp. TaxID=2494211 RepID=UPI003263BE8B
MKPINIRVVSCFAIGVAMIGPMMLTVGAAAAGQTQQAETGKPLKLTATLTPASPRVGDNDLDLMIVDADGKPVSGLKLSARVQMTSMDMGTTQPAVKDMGNGHYRLTVNFSMAGPWRTTLRSEIGKAALSFDAGGKSAWKSPTVTFSPTNNDASKASVASSTMAGMNMGGMSMGGSDSASSASRTGPIADLPFPGYGPYGKPSEDSSDASGMNMPGMKTNGGGMSGMKMDASSGGAAMDDMKPMKMPQLQEQGTYVATGKENWKARAGFGANTGMVAMMSQMMVGGSGMEGMKMPAMKMKFDEQNFTENKDDEDSGPPTTAPGDTSMPGMKMDGEALGETQKPTDAPTMQPAPSSEKGASGSTTPGMKMPPAPQATSAKLKIMGSIGSPKYGDNSLLITIKDASGAPVTGAKITTSVAMTSMDMGTTHPQPKEIGNGQYRATANFSMSGPWRVTIKVTPPSGGAAQTATFNFNAK